MATDGEGSGRRVVLDGILVSMLAVLLALALAAWWRGGSDLVREGLERGGAQLLRYALLLVVSFLAAGVAEVLIPKEWVRGALGVEAGARGIWIGAAAGVITPAGPFVSMPIAAMLMRSGAAPACVVAYLTAWSVLAIQRLVAWEIPILGARFALLRYAVSLLLPIAAGYATRLLLGR